MFFRLHFFFLIYLFHCIYIPIHRVFLGSGYCFLTPIFVIFPIANIIIVVFLKKWSATEIKYKQIVYKLMYVYSIFSNKNNRKCYSLVFLSGLSKKRLLLNELNWSFLKRNVIIQPAWFNKELKVPLVNVLSSMNTAKYYQQIKRSYS